MESPGCMAGAATKMGASALSMAWWSYRYV
jgi:hypothetical protein